METGLLREYMVIILLGASRGIVISLKGDTGAASLLLRLVSILALNFKPLNPEP